VEDPVTLLLRPPVRVEHRDERRRRARQDVLAARLVELHQMTEVIDDAQEVVEHGWVQHAWFAYRDELGSTRLATAHDLHLMAGREVMGACLVGAVVLAGGGVHAAGSQLVQRTLDLTWHTLRRGSGEPVRWCPSPAERGVQTRDLTSWNDLRGRTVDDVRTLLREAGASALENRARTRQEYAAG
jgi:hypothetical protein